MKPNIVDFNGLKKYLKDLEEIKNQALKDEELKRQELAMLRTDILSLTERVHYLELIHKDCYEEDNNTV